MTDEQMRLKESIRKMLLMGILLIVIAGGLAFWCYTESQNYEYYLTEKRREATLESQVKALSAENSRLYTTIEETGKELVSFTEDKIMYVNLASSLAQKYNVRINQLSVSDVQTEGEMSAMTTIVEIEGDFNKIRKFVEEYCGTNYTNRIEVVSCRPNGRYAWLDRGIDGEKILTWFDLSDDERIWEEWVENELVDQANSSVENGLGSYIASATEAVEEPITAEKMFETVPMRIFLSIDFLGRA